MEHEERLNRIWKGMNSRCNNKQDEYYGARGIIVCDRWKNSFENFYSDLISEYKEHVELHGERNTSIDRIETNGNYEPSNCRWATYKVQNNNRREIVRTPRESIFIRLKNPDIFKIGIIKQGCTQGMYASKMNVSTVYLNSIINGKKSIGPKLASKICKDLKVKFEDLFIIETETKEEVK